MGISVPRMHGETTESELGLRELLTQANGFERYAAEKMSEFIQVERDYEGFVRDVITVTNVTADDIVRVDEEAFITYSKDIDATAAVVARNGELPTLYVKGTTVKVTFFTIATPRLTITQWELDTEPYDLMKRTQEKAGQAMAQIEDETFINAVDALIDANPTQKVTSTNSTIQKADLLAIKKIFSRNNVSFATYLMNPATFDDFLLWGENELDDTSQRTIFETGTLPTIWGGIKLVVGILVDEKKIYGLAPKEVLGRMPILRDITLDVQRIPETQDKEVIAYEYIGMFIHSHKAVSRLDLA